MLSNRLKLLKTEHQKTNKNIQLTKKKSDYVKKLQQRVNEDKNLKMAIQQQREHELSLKRM